jgi:hypothetical protein
MCYENINNTDVIVNNIVIFLLFMKLKKPRVLGYNASSY